MTFMSMPSFDLEWRKAGRDYWEVSFMGLRAVVTDMTRSWDAEHAFPWTVEYWERTFFTNAPRITSQYRSFKSGNAGFLEQAQQEAAREFLAAYLTIVRESQER